MAVSVLNLPFFYFPFGVCGYEHLLSQGFFLCNEGSSGIVPHSSSIHTSLQYSQSGFIPGCVCSHLPSHTTHNPVIITEKILTNSQSKTSWIKALWLKMSWTQTQLLRGPQQMNTHSKLKLSYFWKCLRENKREMRL